MNKQTISKKQIINYYDSTEIDYKLIWNLRKSLALHFGYWDDKVKNFQQALERENEILAKIANIKRSDVVLDAGCGVGGSSIFLAKKFGCKVIGITLSQKQADMAAKNSQRNGVASNTEFIVMDFENMTFPDRKFDVVLGIESICHANSKRKFIENSYRILKQNGRLIIADGFANRNNFTDEEKNIMRKWLSGWGVNFLETREKFETFSSKIGFQKTLFTDITENVIPSSKRLYKYSFPAMFFGKIAEFLKLRTKTQTGNIIAARYQYIALLKGLWKYGIFYAEK
jgi:cyclopropane fatty-acyl-phospholipid synthase-like methyltransferase